jgi:ATP:corrinoid adenosyltransferase
MAKMVPDILLDTIENNGEQIFYDWASQLPDAYTVLYSYTYQLGDEVREKFREADFVIVHPSLGYVVVEVKQGEINYQDGQWYELKAGEYYPLSKNPVEQAKTAMFSILQAYKKETKGKDFPLSIRYALCFPECSSVSGILPQSLKESGIWVNGDLENLQLKIQELFAGQEKKPDTTATGLLLDKVLAPSFKLFSSLEDKINMFKNNAQRVLTEEQERILEETEEDNRKIFFGSAGTGKTFVAMEKARRLAGEGKKIFLTCYNKNLTSIFSELDRISLVTKQNFHDFILTTLNDQGLGLVEPAQPEEIEVFYNETLPALAFDYFSCLSEDEKFDAILVDEGQDFKEEWFTCLEIMLKEHGHFYIFADLNQNIFRNGISSLKSMEMSKHKLTINLRNTERINEWITPFTGNKNIRSKLKGGLPVVSIAWTDPSEEKRAVEKEIGRLVSQGLSPNKITILSPHRKENSCLQGLDKIKEWPLIDVRSSSAYGIKFSTIRSFKGLEEDVVMVIGVKDNDKVCTAADVYVGASRARFLLYVFHHVDWVQPKALLSK